MVSVSCAWGQLYMSRGGGGGANGAITLAVTGAGTGTGTRTMEDNRCQPMSLFRCSVNDSK